MSKCTNVVVCHSATDYALLFLLLLELSRKPYWGGALRNIPNVHRRLNDVPTHRFTRQQNVFNVIAFPTRMAGQRFGHECGSVDRVGFLSPPTM